MSGLGQGKVRSITRVVSRKLSAKRKRSKVDKAIASLGRCSKRNDPLKHLGFVDLDAINEVETNIDRIIDSSFS